MADEWTCYEEDYEDISDWDEESESNHTEEINEKPSPIKQQQQIEPKMEEKKEENGTKQILPTSLNKQQLTSSYSPKCTFSSFIVHKYNVLTQEQIKSHIDNMVNDLASTLNLDSQIVSLLLRRFEWKSERLMENYLHFGTQCLTQFGLDCCHILEATDTQKIIECEMCLCDVQISDTFSLECKHRFCSDCWRDYICSTINNKSFNSIFIKCPGFKCNVPLQNKIIKKFLNDEVQWNKFENYIIQHFISSNEQNYRFCPSPGCNFVIFCNDTSPKSLICDEQSPTKKQEKVKNGQKSPQKVYKSKYKQQQQLEKNKKMTTEFENFQFFGQNGKNQKLLKSENGNETFHHMEDFQQPMRTKSDSSLFVQCRCGFDLCFLCGQEYHAPATCQQVEKWNFKCLKESDNAQWIVTNTKKCPKCFTRIERNHGCNHMVCTKCQYEFCWVCMGSWKEHGIGTGGYYRCNKYKPKASMGNKQKLQEKEDHEMDKFVHYFNRFHNHAQSRKFLLESSHKVLRKIKNHLNANKSDTQQQKSWIDVEFLQNAHEEIDFCRQVLKYTYVYAYYLKSGAEKDLFEFLQQDLEKNCEMLHEVCEQNWKNMNAECIINYTNITHRFVKQLLDGIAKGLTR